MYDHIPLYTVQYSQPVTHKNYKSFLSNQLDSVCYNAIEKISSDALVFSNAEFYSKGKGMFCFPHPYSEYAYENLFYLQGFTLMDLEAGCFTKRENMNSFLLCYTYEGKGSLEYEGKKYILSKGEGFLIDGKKKHIYQTEGEHWKHVIFHFSGSFTKKIFEEFSMLGDVHFVAHNQYVFHNKLEQLAEVYEEIASPLRELKISNYLENILMDILLDSDSYKNAVKSLPENMKYLMKYIENNYTNPLSLDYLADFSSMNKYHLIRTFNKYIGCSPQEYIIQLRLKHAKMLLESTDIPVCKIGVRVGIVNENYFGHLFKKRTGITPGNYRKMHRAKSLT